MFVWIAMIQLTEAMDPEANPCQDFYQYACGNWIKNNPIPKSKSSWTKFNIMRDDLSEVLQGKI